MPPNNQFPSPTQTPPVAGGAPIVPAGGGAPIISSGPAPANTPAAPVRKNANSTQNTLLLSEIRDNMVIMTDGSFRAVVACKSINFDLMSTREREGVEYSYQNFLNSLFYPIQILIRSQRVDIGPYIDHLISIRRSQDNMLLGILMDDYTNFIDSLAEEANIMDKSFFITVPFYPTGDISSIVDQGKGFFSKVFSRQQNTVTKIDTATYEKAKTEIKNRVDNVTSGLFQVGIQAVQLNTKELGELYYNVYNPDTAVREPLGNFENVTSVYVKKGVGESAINATTGGQM
jgi:hypothetical protein